jgi:hypothetical protein
LALRSLDDDDAVDVDDVEELKIRVKEKTLL